MNRTYRPHRHLLTVLVMLTVTSPLRAQNSIWEPGYGPAGGNPTSLVIIDEGVLVSTEFGGPFLSTDDGQTWQPYGSFNYLPRIVAQLGDGALLVVSDDEGGVFRLTNEATSIEIAGAGIEGRPIWGAVAENDSVFLTTSTGLFVSGDHARTWRAIDLGIDEVEEPLFVATDGDRILVAGDGRAWYAGKLTDEFVPIGQEIDATITSGSFTQSGEILLSTDDGLYIATDAGGSFSQFGADSGGPIRLVPPVTQQEDGTVWAMTGNRHLLRVRKGGAYQEIGIPTRNPIFSRVLESGTILISDIGGGVWRSTDGGQSFRIVGIPGQGGKRRIMAGPDGELTAAMTYGVGRSTDNGESWVYFYEAISEGGEPFERLSTYTILDDGTILAVGEEGSVMMWGIDGSRSVNVRALSSPIQDIFQIAEDLILAVGPIETFRSIDRGETWVGITMESNSATVDVEGTFWNVETRQAEGPRLFHSPDGLSYSAVDILEDFSVANVDRLPEGGIYVTGTGSDGFLSLTSLDRGETWTEVDVPCAGGFPSPVEIRFGEGLVLVSECGLYSWNGSTHSWNTNPIEIPAGIDFNDLAHTGDYMFLHGDRHTIYRKPAEKLSVPSRSTEHPALTGRLFLRENQVVIRFNEPLEAPLSLRIHTLTGEVLVAEEGLRPASATNDYTLSLPDGLPSGTYMVSGLSGEAIVAGHLLRIGHDR